MNSTTQLLVFPLCNHFSGAFKQAKAVQKVAQRLILLDWRGTQVPIHEKSTEMGCLNNFIKQHRAKVKRGANVETEFGTGRILSIHKSSHTVSVWIMDKIHEIDMLDVNF